MAIKRPHYIKENGEEKRLDHYAQQTAAPTAGQQKTSPIAQGMLTGAEMAAKYKPTAKAPTTSADYLDLIANREDFSLDLNNDALYEQMRRDYINQGRMAMEDTMGQAAALTGGYGNSYAQTAGQQVYNQHLGALNDAIPELYQMGLDRYNAEGDRLLDLYSLYKSEERQAIEDQRYDEEMAYMRERDAEDDRRYEEEIAYRDRRDDVDDTRREDETAYDRDRDAKSDEKWYLANGFVKDENGEWYLPEVPVSAEDKGGWTWTGATDENGNRIFIKDGKEYAFGNGVNPNTGTVNPDTSNGVMANGYQPNNIGGEPVTMSDYTYEGPIREYQGLPLWECDGNYYLWSDEDNQYLLVDAEDDTNPLEDPDYEPTTEEPFYDSEGENKPEGGIAPPSYYEGVFASDKITTGKENPFMAGVMNGIETIGAPKAAPSSEGHSDLADPDTEEWLRYVFTENVRGGGNAGKFGVHIKKDVL